MVLHEDKKWLFISTMKAATFSMYRDLLTVGGKLHEAGPGHRHPLPERRLAKIHFTTCRNPYDRAVSIWASTCVRKNSPGLKAISWIQAAGGRVESFEDFVRIVLLNPRHGGGGLFRDQSSWHRRFILDRVVHVERLEEELVEIVGPIVLGPRKNTAEHTPYKDYLNRRVIRMINKWAEDDFKRCEYRKL